MHSNWWYLCAEVQAELDLVEAELEQVELQVAELLKKQAQLTSRKSALLLQLEEACDTIGCSSSTTSVPEWTMSRQVLQHYDGSGTRHPGFHQQLFKQRCMSGSQFDYGVVE